MEWVKKVHGMSREALEVEMNHPHHTWPTRLAGERVTIRRMTLCDADVEAVARWLDDPRVRARYGGESHHYTADEVRRRYGPRTDGREPIVACILEVERLPAGYMQVYPIEDASDYALGRFDETRHLGAEDTWAMDLFIGRPELWGRGYGREIVGLAAREILEGQGAMAVVIDPHTDNPRAIRAYEVAGFQRVGVLRAHEEQDGVWCDCLLMMRER